MASQNFDHIRDSVESDNKKRQKIVENYIIDINNKLHEMCQFMNLDLKEIKHIHPDPRIREKNREKDFDDDDKRVIIDSILSEEDLVKKAAMKAAGITNDDLKRKSTVKQSSDYVQYVSDNVATGMTLYNESVAQKAHGMAPPKTDWSRVDVSKDEKDKILESLRANPKSKMFSNTFQFDPKDFLGAFKYFEDGTGYNGPFIVSIIDSKEELERYSKIDELKEESKKIYDAKYIILSVYDITASKANEPKYFYVGLNYIGLKGVVYFDKLGSTEGEVTANQKRLLKEYMEAMKIEFDENDKKLKA